VEPLVIDLEAREMGYYHVPTYMADQSGDLDVSSPIAAIDRDRFLGAYLYRRCGVWLFSRGARFEKRLNEDLAFKLRILGKGCMKGDRSSNVRNWSRWQELRH
jgi:UDP-N-acetylglucosamine diphosphorylase / glucose-1-phosphate thymidylyltransferase / UDP-N-acetylgalactosamine diphosphorylase / glucosamine-1-phosphate N-acetyltransferase / galactosamine-1-phosphate N-acetyltransferase